MAAETCVVTKSGKHYVRFSDLWWILNTGQGVRKDGQEYIGPGGEKKILKFSDENRKGDSFDFLLYDPKPNEIIRKLRCSETTIDTEMVELLIEGTYPDTNERRFHIHTFEIVWSQDETDVKITKVNTVFKGVKELSQT